MDCLQKTSSLLSDLKPVQDSVAGRLMGVREHAQFQLPELWHSIILEIMRKKQSDLVRA